MKKNVLKASFMAALAFVSTGNVFGEEYDAWKNFVYNPEKEDLHHARRRHLEGQLEEMDEELEWCKKELEKLGAGEKVPEEVQKKMDVKGKLSKFRYAIKQMWWSFVDDEEEALEEWTHWDVESGYFERFRDKVRLLQTFEDKFDSVKEDLKRQLRENSLLPPAEPEVQSNGASN